MNSREAFEKRFPPATGICWDAEKGNYDLEAEGISDKSNLIALMIYSARFVSWQAAEAHYKAEIERLKKKNKTLIPNAIAECRISMTEFGDPWLCRVHDLEKYAIENADKDEGRE